jgi:hypothetical protein
MNFMLLTPHESREQNVERDHVPDVHDTRSRLAAQWALEVRRFVDGSKNPSIPRSEHEQVQKPKRLHQRQSLS